MKIRLFLAASLLLGLAATSSLGYRGAASADDTSTAKPVGEGSSTDDLPAEPDYEPKSPARLRRSMSAMQFDVTQNEGTERAFQNKYWNNKRKGRYDCLVCGRPLFDSKTKFKSGTGWPSFYEPIHEKSVGYENDWRLFYSRKEVHCARCEAHLGHVFDDGPRPTGKRYCMNSAALKFVDEKDVQKAEEKAAEEKKAEAVKEDS